jgi:hypothetical protein
MHIISNFEEQLKNIVWLTQSLLLKVNYETIS